MSFNHALPQDQPLPSQARSQAALARFIEVGVELLASDAFEQTGIAEIAQLANSSVGTFYRLIGDKEKLLGLVHRGFVVRSQELLDLALDPQLCAACTPREVLERFVDTLVKVYRGQEGLLRALIRRSSADLEFRQRFHGLNERVGHQLAAALGPREPGIAQERLLFAAHALLGIMNHYTVTGSLGPITADAVSAELQALAGAYLGL
jgi:AcrR family transcriptional regulator